MDAAEPSPSPLIAAYRHQDAREGFEVVTVTTGGSGLRLHGQTAAVEEGAAWSVRYEIVLDDRWRTYRAEVWGLAADGERRVVIELDRAGTWRVDGAPRPDLDGCLDVDLESSACTNTIPVHRMGLAVGDESEAPAVYVRAEDLRVERLEQTYRRAPSPDDDSADSTDGADGAGGATTTYAYSAPVFDFSCDLTYDAGGLVLDYPGIATRVL
jgi:uncharacterized protein